MSARGVGEGCWVDVCSQYYEIVVAVGSSNRRKGGKQLGEECAAAAWVTALRARPSRPTDLAERGRWRLVLAGANAGREPGNAGLDAAIVLCSSAQIGALTCAAAAQVRGQVARPVGRIGPRRVAAQAAGEDGVERDEEQQGEKRLW